MFPRLITRYGLATHLALLASLPFVLFPFLSRECLALMIFCLSGITFLCLLVEPSMRAGEHLSIARRRVLGSMVRDVIFWFFILALAVSFVRYLNSGVAADYQVQQVSVKGTAPNYDAFRASFPSDPAERRAWLEKGDNSNAGLRARAGAIFMLEEAITNSNDAVLGKLKSKLSNATDLQAKGFYKELASLDGKVKDAKKLDQPRFTRWLREPVAKGEWVVREPVLVELPASAGAAGLLPLAVLVGISVVVLGIRHGIGLAGRISFGLTASFIMGLGGLVMTLCSLLQVPAFMGAAKVDFLEGPFREPFWGPGFGAWLICALPFGAQAEARKWGASRVPFCLAVAGNACGLLFFSPPPVSTVFLIVAALVAVFCLAYLGRAGSVGAGARCFVMMVIGFASPLFFLSLLKEIEFVEEKTDLDKKTVMETVIVRAQDIYSVKAGGFLALDKEETEKYRKLSPMLIDMAKSVWKKHPWYGAGTGAFRLHVPFIVTKEQQKAFRSATADDWRKRLILQQMKNNASKRADAGKAEPGDGFDWKALRLYNRNPVRTYNSYWTFLAEHGLLGVSLALLGFGILLFSYFFRLVTAVKFLRSQDDADIVIFACPPIVWVTPFALGLLCVLALYEPILDIAPMLFALVVPLAVAAASFPKSPANRKRAVQPLVKESP